VTVSSIWLQHLPTADNIKVH